MVPQISIDIQIMCNEWPNFEIRIQDLVLKACQTLAHDGPCDLSIVLADDGFVQNLNKQWRGQDKPTNVLSFPQDHPSILGDIVLAYETVAQESMKQQKSFQDHALHLVLHGFLHLLGYDHEEDQEAETMEALEIQILAQCGIKSPYESSETVQ